MAARPRPMRGHNAQIPPPYRDRVSHGTGAAFLYADVGASR